MLGWLFAPRREMVLPPTGGRPLLIGAHSASRCAASVSKPDRLDALGLDTDSKRVRPDEPVVRSAVPGGGGIGGGRDKSFTRAPEPVLAAHPPEIHAGTLYERMSEDDLPPEDIAELTDSTGLALEPCLADELIVTAEDVHDAYVEMCMDLCWEPLPWGGRGGVGSFFTKLTGGKKYRSVPNPADGGKLTAKERIYRIRRRPVDLLPPWQELEDLRLAA